MKYISLVLYALCFSGIIWSINQRESQIRLLNDYIQSNHELRNQVDSVLITKIRILEAVQRHNELLESDSEQWQE